MQIRTFNHHTFPSGYTRKSGGIHSCFETDYGSDELRPVKQTLDALSVSLGYKQYGNYLRAEAGTSGEEKSKASRDYIQPLMRHMESDGLTFFIDEDRNSKGFGSCITNR